ncbi:MAG: hypothetical protein AAB588_01015 [Patescibacteria group bacterium]
MQISYSPHPASFKAGLKKLLQDFPKHRARIMERPFAQLPWKNLEPLKHLKAKPTFKHIAVVGMGGSSLGTKALAQALQGESLVFLDNIHPDFISQKLAQLDLKKTLFLLMSKSGETIEVLSLAKVLLSKISSSKNFLAITDNKGSSLGKLAQQKKIPIFQSDADIPGRFSVLSLVGLLPAALAGLPFQEILNGAQKASWTKAYLLACHQYLHFMNHKNISVIFPYHEFLSDAADWYIQLLAESIGKSKKIGVTPTKALGVKDQHSQLQLFLDGPEDKFFIFVRPQNGHSDHKIPGKKYSLGKLFNAEYLGVKQAFLKRKKPFCELNLEALSPAAVGEMLFFLELEVGFLGQMFGVNFENQPAVELSKKITKTLLS